MSYKIVVDSCCDLPKEKRMDSHFKIIPLSIQIDNYNIIDDDTFDQKEFLKKMKESENCPKSSCPSPESYMEAYKGEEDIYVVTLSGKLSGSYNSAMLAKELYLEENPAKNIEVINSCSASVGEVLIALKVQELAESGKKFSEIVEAIKKFKQSSEIKFILESLDNLKKNGRLSNMQAFVASVLNIKPIMSATKEGEIVKLDQARGFQKAMIKMVDMIISEKIDQKSRIFAISHCNCIDKAEFIKNEIAKRCSFKKIIIVEQAGISSLYTDDGGVIVSY